MGGLLLVLYTTLFPFDFLFKEMANPSIDWRFPKPGLNDWFRNILLFIPASAGLTCLVLPREKRGERHASFGGGMVTLLAVLAAGFGLSFIIELLQLFLAVRASSLSDLVANVVGTFLGFLCFWVSGNKILSYASTLVEKSKAHLKRLAVPAFVGYALLAFLISLLLQNGTHLSNWDQTYPLVLGNEQTGDRPWQGYISELYIADRAISSEEIALAFANQGPDAEVENSLLASYQFAGEAGLSREAIYYDQTGHLPALHWQGTPDGARGRASASGRPPPQSWGGLRGGGGVFLAPDHWLKTATSVDFVTQMLSRSSQFTLSATVAAANTEQSGPARIVSISNDPFHRNFTLGQAGTDLSHRRRTPVTGQNATEPEMSVPDVFVDTTPHHLIVTYDGVTIGIYIDDLQRSYTFNFSPEVTLFRYLLPVDSWRIRLNAANIWIYKLLYYGLIFIPLGFLLGTRDK
jgi:glycopeptide antibiotics resistance protein